MALRLDDPSSHSDHALEVAILEKLKKHRVPATFAVIPFSAKAQQPGCLSGAQVPHLVEAQREGTLEIALHGHTHQSHTRLADNNQTEFAARPLDQQIALLQQGKACLEQTFGTVRGFVPPWNSFDHSTLAALKQLRFEYLSGGWEYAPPGMDDFPVLAHSCNLAHLEDAIAEARGLGPLEPAIVMIMHHYDFAESGSNEACFDLDRLDRLLAFVTAQEDIEVMTLAELAASLDPAASAANIHYHLWRERQHWRLNRLLPGYVLLDAKGIRLHAGLALKALKNLPRAFVA